MRSVKQQVKNGMGGSEAFTNREIEGAKPSPVVRTGVEAMPKENGNPKLPMSDEPGETTWSPMASAGSSGNPKIDPSEEPGPTSYSASMASPSESSSVKVPFSEFGVRDPEKPAMKIDSGIGAAGTMPNKKRPFKKPPSMI
jgi:hypothetical protein